MQNDVLALFQQPGYLQAMPHDPSKLKAPTRADLIQAISHAMLYTKGTRRAHDWESINARVAAERLIDGLAASNYVIMQGPPGKGQAETEGERARIKLTD